MGTLGLVTKSGSDPGALLRNGQNYTEIGPASGSSCRFFLLAIVPWGNGSFTDALDEALRKSGGDALINVAVQNSLYGLLPIYNVFTWQCTEIKGTAIKFQVGQLPSTPPTPPS